MGFDHNILMFYLLQIEKRDMAAAQTLRAAFSKVEHVHPGFTYDLVKGLLQKLDVAGEFDMCEALLRLEGRNNSEGL